MLNKSGLKWYSGLVHDYGGNILSFPIKNDLAVGILCMSFIVWESCSITVCGVGDIIKVLDLCHSFGVLGMIFLYFTVMVYYIKWSWEMKSIKTSPILSRYQIPFDVARFSLLVFCWSFCFFVYKILFITFPLLWCLGLYQNNIGPTNFVDFLHFSIFSTLFISVLILTISLLYFSSISDVWRECWG